jgi:hypothetical protein
MAWPSADVDTSNVDQTSDDPAVALPDIENAFDRINDIINNRAVANGVCDLDSSTLVPLARIPATLTGKDADTLDGQHGTYYLKKGTSAPTNYNDAGQLIMLDPQQWYAQKSDDMLAQSDATEYTIGPTGSGATDIWTALDNLPSTANGIILGMGAQMLASSAPAEIAFYAACYRLGESYSANQFAVSMYVSTTGLKWQMTNLCFWVPLDDSTFKFKARWTHTGLNTTTSNAYLLLNGYTENEGG